MEEKRRIALEAHEKWRGKIEVVSRVPLENKADLAVAYTPGVAEPCLVIKDDVNAGYTYTRRGNLVAVITDGTAVLGLGDIGPEAGMPVMEGKCALFKALGGVDAVPLCIRSKDVDVIVNTVAMIAGSFGGINLEDISAPRCFEIERRLKRTLDIPVFHDDQHGTAVIVLAGLINALRVANKSLHEVKVVFSGAGAAGIAIARLLYEAGMRNFIMTDIHGTVFRGRQGMSADLASMADISNPDNLAGTLRDAIAGADVFIGVSAPNLVTPDMVLSMNERAILFPMANPTPEIMPDAAIAAGALVVGSGRSDYPNQINNVLAFPGIFRGALDVRASDINEAMKVAAAHAIANLVSADELRRDYIIPDALDKRVVPAVAKAVAEAARQSGVSRL
jgi:malate dehydrogenase (oxaloacetate-decarboxylating)